MYKLPVYQHSQLRIPPHTRRQGRGFPIYADPTPNALGRQRGMESRPRELCLSACHMDSWNWPHLTIILIARQSLAGLSQR